MLDEIESEARALIQLAPDYAYGHAILGYVSHERGDQATAVASLRRANAPGLPYTAQLRALLAAVAGRGDEALDILSTVDEGSLDGHHSFHLAESYAMAGAHDYAVALVDRAVTLGFHPPSARAACS